MDGGNCIAGVCPGTEDGPLDLLAHAEAYRLGALALLERRGKDGRLSRIPGRLLALQAIELYFNAFLLLHGTAHPAIRAMQHNLEKRVLRSEQHGLTLRPRTRQHLVRLDETREYLVVRYSPAQSISLSEINRITASLEEVKAGVRLGFAVRGASHGKVA